MSMRVAPRETRRSTSACWSSSAGGARSKCSRFFAGLRPHRRTTPRDLRAAARRLDRGLLILVPDQRPAQCLAPEVADLLRAVAGQLTEEPAAGEEVVARLDDAELVALGIGEHHVLLLRELPDVEVPAAEPECPLHRLPAGRRGSCSSGGGASGSGRPSAPGSGRTRSGTRCRRSAGARSRRRGRRPSLRSRTPAQKRARRSGSFASTQKRSQVRSHETSHARTLGDGGATRIGGRGRWWTPGRARAWVASWRALSRPTTSWSGPGHGDGVHRCPDRPCRRARRARRPSPRVSVGTGSRPTRSCACTSHRPSTASLDGARRRADPGARARGGTPRAGRPADDLRATTTTCWRTGCSGPAGSSSSRAATTLGDRTFVVARLGSSGSRCRSGAGSSTRATSPPRSRRRRRRGSRSARVRG